MAEPDNKTIILVVSSLAAGGAERVTIDLFRYLLHHGWDAYLFVSCWGSESNRVYSVMDDSRVCHGAFSKFKLLRSIDNCLRLKTLIREKKPLWLISLGASYELIEKAGAYNQCKVLLSERNWPLSYYSKDELLRVEQHYLKANKVVFQTPEARGCFCGEVQEKGVVIPNPAPDGLPEWHGSDSKRVIYYGRIDAQKRPEIAINAFDMFAQEREGYTLEVYGKGSEECAVRDLIEEKSLADSVTLHGPSSDIHCIASDCLMFISASDYEGISNSMIEALSMGMPCVCTDCAGGGARLAIENGVSGMIVSRGDTAGMAHAMGKIADSKDFAQSVSRNARNSMRRFSREKIFGRWEALLECLDGETRNNESE